MADYEIVVIIIIIIIAIMITVIYPGKTGKKRRYRITYVVNYETALHVLLYLARSTVGT